MRSFSPATPSKDLTDDDRRRLNCDVERVAEKGDREMEALAFTVLGHFLHVQRSA
jgi:hypothetical protein